METLKHPTDSATLSQLAFPEKATQISHGRNPIRKIQLKKVKKVKYENTVVKSKSKKKKVNMFEKVVLEQNGFLPLFCQCVDHRCWLKMITDTDMFVHKPLTHLSIYERD